MVRKTATPEAAAAPAAARDRAAQAAKRALRAAWEGWSLDDRYRQVQSTPAIADVDADGLPEVVTVAYRSTADNMLNSEDGSENLRKSLRLDLKLPILP